MLSTRNVKMNNFTLLSRPLWSNVEAKRSLGKYKATTVANVQKAWHQGAMGTRTFVSLKEESGVSF